MKLNQDYKIREDLYDATKEDMTLPIEILLPPYKGIVYRYKTVSFKNVGEPVPDQPNKDQVDAPTVRFTFDIVDSNKYNVELLRADKIFTSTIGLILNSMMLDTADAETEGQPPTE